MTSVFIGGVVAELPLLREGLLMSCRTWLGTTKALRCLIIIVGMNLCFAGCEGTPEPSAGGGTEPLPRPGAVATSKAVVPPKAEAADDRRSGFSKDRVTLTKQLHSSPFRFTERAKTAGIDFVHFSGMTDARHFPTANGSGVAVFDYDNDGKLDVYFATCTLLPLGTATKGPNRLYKNMGDGTFRDATESSGLGFAGFCHAIIVGDLDNDGDSDVFLANYGPNVLYRNNGDGTFRDISKAAGIDRPLWSSGGALLDYDNDGDLDVYLANYGEWSLPKDDLFCGDSKGKVRHYCSPRSIRTAKHILYRNDGDLTFTDVTDAAGVGRADGHGFGAVSADFDGDGLIDLYVSNDMNPNFLYLNKGDGTFEDRTEVSGAAFDEKGRAQSGMGVDSEDVNGDGRPDLFVTNFANEYNTLYENLGKGLFADTTPYFGLASDTMPFVGWGCALADFDNDGWPDNFVTNGHVDNNLRELERLVDYGQPPLLFSNQEGKRFRLATRDVGPYFDTAHVGRGAAFGDLDDDGDIDIVVNHKDGAPALLRNDTRNENGWIRLDLQGTRSNRDAVGARVEAVVGDRTIHRQRKGGYSLQSSNDPRLLIGVGKADEVTRLTVRWPSGAVSTLEHLKAGQTHKVIEPADAPKDKAPTPLAEPEE